jgi:hypothetical protein
MDIRMNRLSWTVKISIIALGILLISSTIFVQAQQINQADRARNTFLNLPTILITNTPTRPINCVPLPQELEDNLPLTPTPDHFVSQIPNSRPTVTPRSYTNTFDLNPELPIQDKSQIVVFRCDGYLDLYLVGPDTNIDQTITLAPGDIIISSAPPRYLMGQKPPEPQNRPTMITLTPLPYPPPNTSIPETITSFPYPPPTTSTPVSIEP